MHDRAPVRHLYVHVPFCAHRCGYCDFVTVTGHDDCHAAYVEALLGELAQERAVLDDHLETLFLGGGTPTLLRPPLLRRLLEGLPPAEEVTVEANPETVDAAMAEALAGSGVTRVSVGAQSFGAPELAVLERRARPDQVRTAVGLLHQAGIRELSLDLLFGIPGQTPEALERDLACALELEPDHLSCYELEAKPGTRFTHRHGGELARQAEQLEDHYQQVIERLEGAGYRWYETANFCRDGHRARHNLAYWTGRDYLGLGIGAVSTLGLERRTNRPRLAPYIEAVGDGRPPPRQVEILTPAERARERVILGLRLDEPVALDGLADGLDQEGVARMTALGMVVDGNGTLALTRRGRMLANSVTAAVISS